MAKRKPKPEYEVDYGDLSDAYDEYEETPWFNGEDYPNDTVDYGYFFGDFG